MDIKISMDEVKVMKVIVMTKTRRGGDKNTKDPIRVITEIFTLDGEKIAEYDPVNDQL